MILFVCSAARLRSRTAELLCLFAGLEARSAGTEDGALALVNDNLLRNAEYVFCMESHHKQKLKNFNHYDSEKTFVLNIEDDYDRLDPSLVKILVKKVENLNKDLSEKMEYGYNVIVASGFVETLGTKGI